MKNKKVPSLKKKMLLISMLSIGISFLVIFTMFLHTTKSLQKKTMESLAHLTDEVGAKVDGVFKDVKNVSEAIANEPRLLEYLDRVYLETQISDKNAAVLSIRNRIFKDFNRTEEFSQIGAIYTVPNQELFNFTDYNLQGRDTIDNLLDLGVTSADKLSRYCWYSLQDNFLTERRYEDARRDKVILGSRRIYSPQRVAYPYVHVFVLEEKDLYACYEGVLEQTGGDVFVLTSDGGLLSSSRLDVVESGEVPDDVSKAAVQALQGDIITSIDGEDYFVKVKATSTDTGQSSDDGWLTVITIPRAKVMQDINKMYVSIFAIMLFCIVLCGGMVFYLYQKFMNPISALSSAMHRVDNGDLEAYVEHKEDNSETSQMLLRYNLMLKNINRYMEEQLEYERVKKDLDMQVLTSQINPHFLYNTLETIVWKSREVGRPDIGHIASSLGRLYRLSVNDGRVWTTLAREVEHVKSYIEIQRARYENEFTISYCVQPEALEMSLPKLILQPVVENIFLHAMPECDTQIDVKMIVRMINEQTVEIKVIDNGPGISKDRLEQIRRSLQDASSPSKPSEDRRSSGIGLRNINARLQLYMGQRDAIRIYSKQNVGTKVCIYIKKMDKDKNKQ